jgi:pentatricopeptide repeat protein
VETNTIVYNATMSACSKGGAWERALELFDDMPGLGHERSTITYNVAMGACMRGGDWERALELFDAMPDEGLERDAVSVNTAMAAAEAGGDDERLRALAGGGAAAKEEPKPDAKTKKDADDDDDDDDDDESDESDESDDDDSGFRGGWRCAFGFRRRARGVRTAPWSQTAEAATCPPVAFAAARRGGPGDARAPPEGGAAGRAAREVRGEATCAQSGEERAAVDVGGRRAGRWALSRRRRRRMTRRRARNGKSGEATP